MEIHPPIGSIHSSKEFMLHLLTITVGVLIALGLESVVEHRHNRHLVSEASSNLEKEIRHNREGLKEVIRHMEQSQGQLKAILDVVRKVEADRDAKTGEPPLDVTITSLRSTAWSTAAGSGALGHMDYEKLEHYTGIYELQKEFMIVQQKAVDSMLELESWGVLLHGDHKRISDEQCVEAERAVGRSLAATGTALHVGKVLDAEYAGFLGGK
jgi:hypothetical protein